MAKQNNSLRTLAAKFNCSYETLRNFKKAGVDLDNENEVVAKLAENPKWNPPQDMQIATPIKATGEKGLTAAIDRLRDSELLAHGQYLEAQKQNPAIAISYLKTWTAILEQLRKIEESNPDILEANSNSISKEELAKSLGNLFQHLRQDLEGLPHKLSTLGQNTNKDELQKLIADEVNRIIETLYNWKGL